MIIQKHIKVRSTALALSKDNSKAKDTTLAVQAQPAASSSYVPDAPSYGDQLMMHLLASFQRASASILSGNAQREPVIEFLRSKSLASGSSSLSLVSAEQGVGPKVTAEEEVGPLVTAANEVDPLKDGDHEMAKENDNEARTLESFEEANFAMLQERNANKKMKRPAACGEMISQKRPKAKAKASGKAKAKASCKMVASSLPKGCLRCRGNPNGCTTCLKDSFNGMRLTRQQWVQHAKLNNLK